MSSSFKAGLVLLAAALALAAPAALAQEGPKLTIGGTTYTKWLWGTMRNEGALFNFADTDPPGDGYGQPGDGYGDNGQGTEIELLINAKLSRQVEVNARLHSRFNQNHWTNFGGFGGDTNDRCTDGDCGEFDPRSNQYVKLRGAQVILTPGYSWIDRALIGSHDLGQFDPFVVGRIRYIDRDNAAGLFFMGSGLDRRLSWDLARISLPRLWAGPGYSTGDWNSTDAAYAGQLKFAPNQTADVGLIANYTNDSELSPEDILLDDGRTFQSRYWNAVAGAKAGVHLGPWVDLRGAFYYSWSDTGTAGDSYGGISSFGPVVLGEQEDFSFIVDYVAADPLGVGLSLKVQGFFLGSDFNSIMASRREADVLLTEGYDATWALPGPANDRYRAYYKYRGGLVGGIGYGGWSGTAQQVPTVNVDNSFTDFDEPAAESAIGWTGITVNPVWTSGRVELEAEYTFLGYDTNWQAYGRPDEPLQQTPYPGMDMDSGVGHNYRSNYVPFQDKSTQIAVVRAKYGLEVGRGVDLFGKVKYIREVDDRMTDARFLPYLPGTPIGGAANDYSPGNTTASVYTDPPIVAGEALDGTTITGPQWKPFRSLSDDDRDLKYWSFNIGAGYQVFDDLYVALTYAKYLADLLDGNTAFQVYGGEHPMSSGKHDKNQIILNAKYVLAGIEFGFEGQYNFGTYEPDFGRVCTADGQTDCFVLQRIADATQAAEQGFPVGTRGFFSRNGFGNAVFNPIDEREFENWRLKAFMKAQF